MASIKLNHSEEQVLNTVKTLSVKNGMCCDKDIADALKWEINLVTPRRNNLVKFRMIQTAGKHKSPHTNRQVTFYKHK